MPIKFKTSKENIHTMNLTSLIDVIFLLLVFFVMTSSFQSPAIHVNLPKADLVNQPNSKEENLLVISSDNQYYLNSELVAKEQIVSKLSAKFINNQEKSLAIKADQLVSYSTIFEALEFAKKAGVEKYNLLYDEK
jgi:biopolymer transport protein ExbD